MWGVHQLQMAVAVKINIYWTIGSWFTSRLATFARETCKIHLTTPQWWTSQAHKCIVISWLLTLLWYIYSFLGSIKGYHSILQLLPSLQHEVPPRETLDWYPFILEGTFRSSLVFGASIWSSFQEILVYFYPNVIVNQLSKWSPQSDT